ncbi:hypothetical protein JTE90_000426 [Oedothorax gibbosus]|uniref:Uncharacterized protein n=1 Tax=Oedothorax gibbosus TaxID=931172 RepID=A0AAV6TCW6_9ARAC|nr:hypothetical protein JTE90_000426 [Oedothorax gibbosus]
MDNERSISLPYGGFKGPRAEEKGSSLPFKALKGQTRGESCPTGWGSFPKKSALSIPVEQALWGGQILGVAQNYVGEQ